MQFVPIAEDARLLVEAAAPGASGNNRQGVVAYYLEGEAGWFLSEDHYEPGKYRFWICSAQFIQPVRLQLKTAGSQLVLQFVISGEIQYDLPNAPGMVCREKSCCLFYLQENSLQPLAFAAGGHLFIFLLFPALDREELMTEYPLIQQAIDQAVYDRRTKVVRSCFGYKHRSGTLLAHLLDPFEGGGIVYNMYLEGILLELCRHFLEDIREAEQREEWAGKRSYAVDSLGEYIMDHLEQSGNTEGALSPDVVSVTLGISRYLFKKLLRERFSCTWHQYITRIRMQHAMTLLDDENRTVADIAYTLDYRDPGSFTRAFREYFGMSPSAYRLGKK